MNFRLTKDPLASLGRRAHRSKEPDRKVKSPMEENRKKKLDPLFQLFEHYLVTRSYEDSAKFTKELAAEYLVYLDSTPAHVPFHNRENLLEDLESEAREMLVKKMYGCVRRSDYLDSGKVFRFGESKEIEPMDLEAPAQLEESKK